MAVTDHTESRYLIALRQSLPWAVERFLLYMRSSRYWLVVLTASAITGISGPFGLEQALEMPWRILFWSTLLIPSIPFALAVSLVFREMARQLSVAWGWAALAAGLVSVIPIALYSSAVDALFLPPEQQLPMSYIFSSSSVTVVVLTIVANAFFPTLQPLWGFHRVRRHQPLPTGHEDFGAMFDEPDAPTVPDLPPQALPRQALEASPLFERLPDTLGQDIVCIRADNHHIEITTPLGMARVLMRLGDAEADLAPFPGMRVHRSWWVNLAHVASVDAGAANGGAELVLGTGTRVPVSRGQREAVIGALRIHGIAALPEDDRRAGQ